MKILIFVLLIFMMSCIKKEDKSKEPKTITYRLQEIDINGDTTTSKVVFVRE
jgi:hypothetical protein